MPKALAHLTQKHAPIKEYHGGRFQMPHVLYRASLGKVDQSKRWQKIWKKKKKKKDGRKQSWKGEISNERMAKPAI